MRLPHHRRLVASAAAGSLLCLFTGSPSMADTHRRGFHDTLADAGYVALPGHHAVSYTVKAHQQLAVTLPGAPTADAAGIVVSLTATASSTGALTLWQPRTHRPDAATVALVAHRAVTGRTVATSSSQELANLSNHTVKVRVVVEGYFPTAAAAFASGAPGWFTPVAATKAVSVRLGSHKSTTYKTLKAAPPRASAVVLSVSALATRKGALRSFAWHSAYKTTTALALTPGVQTNALQTVQPSGEHWVGLSNLSPGPAAVTATALGYVLPFHVPTQPQYVQAAGADGRALVAWQPPLDLGGLPITGYKVTVLDRPTYPFTGPSYMVSGTALGVAIPLASAHDYYFAVTPINLLGEGGAQTTNTPVRLHPAPVPPAPLAPYAVSASASTLSGASVSWSVHSPEPSPATSYTVTGSLAGSVTVPGSATTAFVPLDGRVSETFTVTATNSSGSSGPSAPSNQVTAGGVAGPGPTTRVSVATSPAQPSTTTVYPDEGIGLSSDGRHVVFASEAPDLVPGDTNGSRDVFVRDNVSGTTTRVSVATDGTQSNGISGDPVISADGRYVSFDSSATNLVAGGTTGQVNVFRHDLDSGETTVVSVGVGGAQSTGYAPSISADGRYISFTSSAGNLVTGDTNAQTDVFVRDLVGAVTTKASVATDATQGDAPSLESSISGDGQLVAFVSTADTFVSGAGTPYGEVFLRNRATGTTTLVSAQPDGHAAPYGAGEPILSGNGQWVAYESGSDVVGDGLEVGGDFERNLATGATTRISAASDGSQSSDDQDYRRMSLSADGQRAVFTFPEAAIVPGYGGQNLAVFVHDLATASTDLVSVGNDGVEAPGDPEGVALSGDGAHAAFGATFSAGRVDAFSTPGVFVRSVR